MKKLFLCLLAVVMLISAASVLAAEPVEKSNIVNEFLKETNFEKEDIALQSQDGEKISDLVIRVDEDNIHLVTRNGDTVESHIQLNPTGIYTDADGSVSLLRFSTINTIAEEIGKSLGNLVAEIIENLPEVSEEDLPTEAEVFDAVSEMVDVMAKVEEQEEADAMVLQAAAMDFANNFKPEYILDVKDEDNSYEVSLRGEAFALALGEAIDELMSNQDLGAVLDRQAEEGDPSFADAQMEWLQNRDEFLEAISTIESTGKIDADGSYESHFQIGEEGTEEEDKVLECDTKAWTNEKGDEAVAMVTLGFKDEDPIIVYEFEMDAYNYWEKLSTVDNSYVEVNLELDGEKTTKGKVVTIIDGEEYLKEEIGPDYFYLKGKNGGISTSVRETWTGKTRYEVVAESADGKETSLTVDFYEDYDSLVCEVYTSESDNSIKFMLSRIDKLAIDDLSAVKNLNEITAENVFAEINAEIEKAMKPVYDYLKPFVDALEAETAPAK